MPEPTPQWRRSQTRLLARSRRGNVELDDHGRVVAFSGLSLTPTAHRFTVAGRTLYTWCAWDTLFLPALLGQSARVESPCPITGTAVRLEVEPSGVRDVDPEEVWVSFPARGHRVDGRHHRHVLLSRALPRWPRGRRPVAEPARGSDRAQRAGRVPARPPRDSLLRLSGAPPQE